MRPTVIAGAAVVVTALFGPAVPAQIPTTPEAGATVELDPTERRAEVYLRLMNAQMALGDRNRSLDVLRELRLALELEPDSAALHGVAASMLLQADFRREAERVADRALELDPDEKKALRVLADLALSNVGRGDTAGINEAIVMYERLAEDPDVEDEVLLILARLEAQTGDSAGAVKYARRLSTRQPADRSVTRLLVDTLAYDGRQEEALRTVIDYLVTNPYDRGFAELAEDLAADTGAWDVVAEGCSRLRQGSGERGTTALLCGNAFLAVDRLQEALIELETAVAMNPGDRELRRSLSRAYAAVGRLAEGVELARELADEDPGDLEARLVIANVQVQQGDVEGAVETYRAVLDAVGPATGIPPDRRDWLRIRIARILLTSDRVPEATDILESLELPETTEAVELRARAAIRIGESKRGRSLIKKLRNDDAASVAALVEGEAALVAGDIDEALASFDEAVLELGNVGRIRASQLLGEFDHDHLQERYLRDWVADEPASAAARFALGGFLERSGRFDLAESELRQVIEMEPGHAAALNYLGYSLADRNTRLEEALVLIERALDLDPWNGAYLDSLGWVYYRMGRYEEAVEPLEQAAREYPRDPTVLEHLGDVYDRLGDEAEARRAWERALEAGPEDPEAIREKLDRAGTAVDDDTTADEPDNAAANLDPSGSHRLEN